MTAHVCAQGSHWAGWLLRQRHREQDRRGSRRTQERGVLTTVGEVTPCRQQEKGVAHKTEQSMAGRLSCWGSDEETCTSIVTVRLLCLSQHCLCNNLTK